MKMSVLKNLCDVQQSLFGSLFSDSEEKSSKKKNDIKEPSKKDMWVIHVDGASRGNPGPAGVGVYITKNGKAFLKKGFFIGARTNNQAEYIALLAAIHLLKLSYKEGDGLTIISDSQLLIFQMQGIYKVKQETLKVIYDVIKKELKSITKVTYEHVLREYNTIADALANEGIDKKVRLPFLLSDYGIVE